MFRFNLSVIAGLVLFSMASGANADFVTNGGFENGPPVASSYTTPYETLDPLTGIPGWTLSATDPVGYYYGAIRNMSSEALTWGTHSGNVAIDLEGGWLSQNVTLPAGPLQVSFWLAEYAPDRALNPLVVTLDGTPLTVGGSGTVTPVRGGWTQYTTDSTNVTAGTYALKFASTVHFVESPFVDTGYTTLDDVSIVPEPSGIVLTVIGAISLLAYAWRKRR